MLNVCETYVKTFEEPMPNHMQDLC